MEFLDKKIEEYIELNTSIESDILKDLNRETWSKVLMPRMLSGHIQGRVLSLFSSIIKPKNIIEIGTYTGYSALCLAEGLASNGELHTIEINEEHALIANKYFKKSKYSKNIIQHIGSGIEIIPKINKKFQLAFIDADKENYSNYLENSREKKHISITAVLRVLPSLRLARARLATGDLEEAAGLLPPLLTAGNDPATRAQAEMLAAAAAREAIRSILYPVQAGTTHGSANADDWENAAAI